MNQLPQHRQCINGRTWGRQWSPADFDPVQRFPSPSSKWASVAMAVAIGVAVALVWIKWIDWSLS